MNKILLKIESKIFRILYNRFKNRIKISVGNFAYKNCEEDCILKDNKNKKCILFDKEFNKNPIEKCSRIFSSYYDLFK